MQKTKDSRYYADKAGRTQNKTQARMTYLRAIKNSPSNGEINHECAKFLREKKYYKEAEFRYKKTSIMMPISIDVYNEWGILLDRQGKLEGQEELYRKTIEIESDFVEGLCNLGAVLAEKGRFDEAMPLYEKALEIRPNDVITQNNLGSGYLKLGKYEKAIENLQKVLERDRSHLNAHINLGLTNTCLGKDEEAKRNYKKVVELIGNSSDRKEVIRRGCERLLSLAKEGLLGEGTDEEKRSHNERFSKAVGEFRSLFEE